MAAKDYKCTHCGETEISEFYSYAFTICKKCNSTRNTIRLKEIKAGTRQRTRKKKYAKDKLLEKEDWEKLLGVMEKGEMKLLFVLLARAGLRIREALNLTREDIVPKRGAICVQTLKTQDKNAPKEELLVGEAVTTALQVHLASHSSSRVFNVSYDTAFRTFKTYVKRAGLNPRLSPHCLRHYRGTYTYGTNKDIREVQAQLRHKDIHSSYIYVQYTTAQKQEMENQTAKDFNAEDLI